MCIPSRIKIKRGTGVIFIPTACEGRERERVGGNEARFGSMAPDQWSIARTHQYTSCWRSELRLHRWKRVGRARVWWWFMSARQMFYFGETMCDWHEWRSDLMIKPTGTIMASRKKKQAGKWSRPFSSFWVTLSWVKNKGNQDIWTLLF